MSDTPRMKDNRDVQLSDIYRAAGAEAPPPALDDAIRAAARREVSARPQRTGTSFMRNWQMPLSIAAVLVLCVSLVVLMRDEGSELTQVPRADAPASGVHDAAENASAVAKIEAAPDAARAKNNGPGLPSTQTNSSSAGANAHALGAPAAGSTNRAEQIETPQETKRRADAPVPRSAPASVEQTDIAANVPAAAPAASAGKLQARRDASPEAERPPVAAGADARSRGLAENVAGYAPDTGLAAAPRREPAAADRMERDAVRPQIRQQAQAAPTPVVQSKALAAATAAQEKSAGALSKETADVVAEMTRLSPEKWLDRIDELRRQGRIDEARAGLTEFRRRYPDYTLPATMRDLARP